MRRFAMLGSLVFTFWLQGCADEQAVEEPVKPSTEENKSQEAEATDSFDAPAPSADGADGNQETMPPDDTDLGNKVSPPPAGQDDAMSMPEQQQPVPQPNAGGIISGGNKMWDDCKTITNFNKRKKCFADAQKALKQKP